MTETVKHTPGEWRVAEKNNGGSVIRNEDGVYIARANQVREMAENACLIAAGPDMLAALKAIAKEARKNKPNPDTVFALATDAISKAEAKS